MNLLERSDLLSFLPGALRLERRGSTVRPWRLTEAQVAHYEQLSEGAAIRSRCVAGIALHLRTSSPWLEVAWTSAGGARAYLGINLEVNGVVVDSLNQPDGNGDFIHRWSIPAAAQPQEVRLVLPHYRDLVLTGIHLEDGAFVEPLPRPARKLLCLGDSITQGMEAISPTETVTVQLAQLLKADLLNQGIGGHVFDAASLAPLPTFRPNWITVAYGTNDWGRGLTPEAFDTTVRAYLDRLMGLFDAPVFLVTPLWRKNWQEPRSLGNLQDLAVRLRVCAQPYTRIQVVDGFTLIPNHPAWFADGLHPNERGFMHYAINLFRALQSAPGV